MRVPPVAQKHGNALQEPMICERCGAFLLEGRGGVSITAPSMPLAGVPALHANKSVAESTTGVSSSRTRTALTRRFSSAVCNVANRAEFTRPERRLISMEWKAHGSRC